MLLFQTLELVPVLFQHGCFHLKRKTVGTKFSSRLSIFFHLVFLVCGEGAAVDHVVEGEVGDLLQAARRHVQAHLVKSDFRGLQFVVCQLFVDCLLGCPKKSKSPNFGMSLTPVVFIG